MPRGSLLALIAATWLWLDLLGVLLSTLSTRVYFGWKGVPGHGALLAILPVLAFCGPALARAWSRRRGAPRRIGPWMLASLAAYAAIAARPAGDVLVALAVGGSLLAGLTLALLLARVSSAKVAAAAMLAGVCLDLVGRSVHGGLLAAVGGEWGVLAGLAALVAGAALAERHPPVRSDARAPDRAPHGRPGVALGLLLGLGGTISWNPPLWSAPWPGARDADGFLLSFAAGTLVGLVAATRGARSPRVGRVILAAAALACGLGLLACSAADPWAAAPATRPWLHGVACAGLATLVALALAGMVGHTPDRRLAELQLGFLGTVAASALFMLRAEPAGFWVALAGSTAILWASRPAPLRHPPPFARVALPWAAIALVPLVGLAARPSPPPAPSSPVAPSTVEATSSNVRYGWTDDDRFDPEAHLRWLAAHPSDLLGLEELSAGSVFAGFQDLRALYAERLGGFWAFGEANWGFGNALRSRWPIRQVEVRAYAARALMRRSALWARVDVDGRPLTVVVTHLSHLAAPNPVRTAQARELRDWLAAEPGPWILLGDLNAEPHEPEIRMLLDLAHPAFRERPELLSAPTHPSRTPRRRIDYVLTSPHLEPLAGRVLDTGGSSDHRPVRLRAGLRY